jgi:hypothetical protein
MSICKFDCNANRCRELICADESFINERNTVANKMIAPTDVFYIHNIMQVRTREHDTLTKRNGYSILDMKTIVYI